MQPQYLLRQFILFGLLTATSALLQSLELSSAQAQAPQGATSAYPNQQYSSCSSQSTSNNQSSCSSQSISSNQSATTNQLTPLNQSVPNFQLIPTNQSNSSSQSPRSNQPTPSAEPASRSIDALQQTILGQINQYRADLGLPPLTLDARISDQAQTHSQDMANGISPFGHDGFTRRIQAIALVIPYRSAAENVAYNQGYSDPATQAVQGWLKSPGHRQNIEGQYNLTGIGVARNSKGEYYFTQIFLFSTSPTSNGANGTNKANGAASTPTPVNNSSGDSSTPMSNSASCSSTSTSNSSGGDSSTPMSNSASCSSTSTSN